MADNSINRQPLNVACASNGDNVLIEGEAGYALAIHAAALTFASAVTATVKDSAGKTMGAFQGGTPVTLDELRKGDRFVTTAGADLVLNLSSGVATKGTLWYSKFKV